MKFDCFQRSNAIAAKALNEDGADTHERASFIIVGKSSRLPHQIHEVTR